MFTLDQDEKTIIETVPQEIVVDKFLVEDVQKMIDTIDLQMADLESQKKVLQAKVDGGAPLIARLAPKPKEEVSNDLSD